MADGMHPGEVRKENLKGQKIFSTLVSLYGDTIILATFRGTYRPGGVRWIGDAKSVDGFEASFHVENDDIDEAIAGMNAWIERERKDIAEFVLMEKLAKARENFPDHDDEPRQYMEDDE